MKKIVVFMVLSVLILSSCSKNEDEIINFYYISRSQEYNELISDLINDFSDDNDVEIRAIPYFHDELKSITSKDTLSWDFIEVFSSDFAIIKDDSLLNVADSLKYTGDISFLKIKSNNNKSIPFILELPYLYVNTDLWNIEKGWAGLKKVKWYIGNPFEYSINYRNKLMGFPVYDKHSAQKYLLPFFNYLSTNNYVLTSQSVYKFINIINNSYLGTQKEVENAFLNKKISTVISDIHFEKKLKNSSVKFHKTLLINPDNYFLSSESTILCAKNSPDLNSNSVKLYQYLNSYEVKMEINDLLGINTEEINKHIKSILTKKDYVDLYLIDNISKIDNNSFQLYLIDMVYGKYSPEYLIQVTTEGTKNIHKKHK